MHRWETGRPDLFDVLLRKKSAFHKRAVFATRADRRSVALKYQRAHWEACHGGALLWCLTSFLRANTKTGYTHNSSLSAQDSETVAQVLLIFIEQRVIFKTHICVEMVWLRFQVQLHNQITQIKLNWHSCIQPLLAAKTLLCFHPFRSQHINQLFKVFLWQ